MLITTLYAELVQTKAESKLFLDEMDSTLKNLNAWKGRSSAEDGDLMLLEERPETDGQDFPIPISHDDNVGSIRQYNCSPDMKEKVCFHFHRLLVLVWGNFFDLVFRVYSSYFSQVGILATFGTKWSQAIGERSWK